MERQKPSIKSPDTLPKFPTNQSEEGYIRFLVQQKIEIQKEVNELLQQEQSISTEIKAIMNRRRSMKLN